MSAFTQAFYDRLSGDPTLVALLGTYAGLPSIFTKTPIPVDFKTETNGPYIVTDGEASDNPGSRDTKNSTGRDILRDIRCYRDIKGSGKDIEAIAERVRTLFHRHKLTVSGFTVYIAEATGPIPIDEDDTFGRVVSVRLVMSAT